MCYAKDSSADIVVSMGSQSEALMHKNYRNGSIPIVTSTNKDPVLLGQIERYTAPRKSNIAYTSLNVPLSIQMQYLTLFKPNLLWSTKFGHKLRGCPQTLPLPWRASAHH
jgi:putative ABC transport system substrate-binding protein